MKKGDILLIYHKIDPLAWLIRFLAGGEYNHIAWAINDKEVIESVGKGIIVSPISKFLTKRYNIKLLRFTNLSKELIEKITKRLINRKCKYNLIEYYISFFIMMCIRRTHRTTCCNFISYELIKEGYYINKKHYKVIVPEDFNVFKRSIDVTDELWS